MASSTSELKRTLASQEATELTFAIIYENIEAGCHARDVCDVVTQRLGQNVEYAREMWRFDVLKIRECRELAAQAAAQANVIMIATQSVSELPVDVKAWIELWLREERELQALVGLCHRPDGRIVQNWPLRSYLAGVAERGQIAFFAEPDIWPEEAFRRGQMALEFRPEELPLATMSFEVTSIRDMSLEHWGLNE
jgi:hypothetical protein